MDAARTIRRPIGPAGWVAAACIAWVLTSFVLAGPGGFPAFIHTLLNAGWPAGVFLLTAFGFGRLARPVLRLSAAPNALQMGIGLAGLLTLIHLLGVFGLLATPPAIGLCVIGCALAIDQLVRTNRDHASRDARAPSSLFSPWLLLLVVPLAVLSVASASPPGWLWDSEFGAYDALSYHFQLPQQWHRLGRIVPVEHNIYSYLPNYLESVYTFVAALTGAPVDGPLGHGLTAGTGWRLLSCHFLHAALGLVTAWMLGAFVRTRLAHITTDRRARRGGAWTGGVLALATPWVIVVGSLGYNELGVTALGGAAMLAAGDRTLGPITRSTLSGLLVGAACGCKPTALFLVTPVVGLILLDALPARAWVQSLLKLTLPACAAGAIMLSPWMIRNALRGGNPVFPQMTGVFGQAHWSDEQVERYQGAHKYSGPAAARVRLFVWSDPEADDDSPPVVRFRGAANWQWGMLFPGAIGLGVVLLGAPATRRDAAVLLGGLGLQLFAWLFLTHLQSRFLLPCVLPACALVGLRAGACNCRRVRAVAVGFIVVQSALLLWIYSVQSGGHASDGLTIEPGVYAGRPYSPELGGTIQQAWVNHELDAGAMVYLLGDATPLYFDRPVVYNTTWDAWPIGEAIGAAPASPDTWTDQLRTRGIDYVLYAPSEVARLHASGWCDPSVTPDRIDRWVRTLGAPVMRWDRSGRWLYRLPAQRAAEGTAP